MASTAIRSSPLPPSPNSNKRKRNGSEQDNGRNMRSPHTNGDDSQQAEHERWAPLLQGLAGQTSADENTRTAQAALAAPMQAATSYPEPFDPDASASVYGLASVQAQSSPSSMPGGAQMFDTRSSNKPAVGTQAWHQLRKDNHKEVERRRREVINEGIENIAKIVPGTEKNKGAILQRTCQYITELQQKIAAFENERNLFNITQTELTSRNEKLRESAQRAWNETHKWQQRCREANLQFDDYDIGPGDELTDDPNVDPHVLPS